LEHAQNTSGKLGAAGKGQPEFFGLIVQPSVPALATSW